MNGRLKVGDVVVLKSGGPRMTVNYVSKDGDKVTCVWFVDDKNFHAEFRAETVKLFEKVKTIEMTSEELE